MVIPTGSIFTQDLIKISVSEFSNVKCETSELVHASGYGLYIVTTQWGNIKLSEHVIIILSFKSIINLDICNLYGS
jgi:hypothetical protein